MRPWSRSDTQEWISQLENRIADIEHYITRTTEWCENNGVWDTEKIFACLAMTVIWVSHMRNEPISRRELLELLGQAQAADCEDAEYTMDPAMLDKDLHDILILVVLSFDDETN